jgi:hypothetical protein
MTSDNKKLTEKRTDCKAEKALSLRRRFLLVVVSLWLQVMVVIFIVVEIKHRVRTPVTEWVSKAIRVLKSMD